MTCINVGFIVLRVFLSNNGVFLRGEKAPAGTLGGAPSMFLCLGDIESALFMSHLCPQGSNEAYFTVSYTHLTLPTKA